MSGISHFCGNWSVTSGLDPETKCVSTTSDCCLEEVIADPMGRERTPGPFPSSHSKSHFSTVTQAQCPEECAMLMYE